MRAETGTKVAVAVLVLLLGACAAGHRIAGTPSHPAPLQDERRVWMEFVDLLRSGAFPRERVAPYREELRDPLLGFLGTMSRKANWNEWHRDPETFRAGDPLHVLLPLTYDGQTATYCFSFAITDKAWLFQHLEAITIRADRFGPLPASRFPDLPEKDKAWMREEIQVSRDVWMFNTLATEKGRDAAFAWFRDGAGYALAARAWVPFASELCDCPCERHEAVRVVLSRCAWTAPES